MKIYIILGTRPEIAKFSSIMREIKRLGLDYFILHTGQHYTYNMDKIFYEQLELPEAKYNIDLGSGTHGRQTGKMRLITYHERPQNVRTNFIFKMRASLSQHYVFEECW